MFQMIQKRMIWMMSKLKADMLVHQSGTIWRRLFKIQEMGLQQSEEKWSKLLIKIWLSIVAHGSDIYSTWNLNLNTLNSEVM